MLTRHPLYPSYGVRPNVLSIGILAVVLLSLDNYKTEKNCDGTQYR